MYLWGLGRVSLTAIELALAGFVCERFEKEGPGSGVRVSVFFLSLMGLKFAHWGGADVVSKDFLSVALLLSTMCLRMHSNKCAR